MTPQSSGYPLPALPSHRLSGYDPPFQISGLAGIVDSGPFPFYAEGGYIYAQFLGNMNLRESPSTKAKKLGTVKTDVVYYVEARTWEKNTKGEIANIGGTDRCWYKVSPVSANGFGDVVGWACAAENVKISETEYLTVPYAVQLKSDTPLSSTLFAQYSSDKKSKLETYKKLTAKSGGGGGGGSAVPPPPSGEEIGAEEGGLGTGMTIAIGLGVAAVVYFLILKGKKK